MTTRAKLNLASLTSSALMFMNIFSRPLGISEVGQWALTLGVFLPLGFVFYYLSQIKAERANDPKLAARSTDEILGGQRKTRKRLIIIWIASAGCALAAPVWLPLMGVSLGVGKNLFVGVITAGVVSIIFFIRLRGFSHSLG